MELLEQLKERLEHAGILMPPHLLTNFETQKILSEQT